MDVDYRRVLMRFYGTSVLAILPLVATLLVLSHDHSINYRGVMQVLVVLMLLNILVVILPLRRASLVKYYNILFFVSGMIFIVSAFLTIFFTGGVKSPFFPLLLLVTSFGTTFFESPVTAFVLVGISSGLYAFFSFKFIGIEPQEMQLLTAQIIFLLLITYLVNRMQSESKEQERVKNEALRELKLLSEMDQATSRFVSAVSFEMRTPLTSIQGFSEMLLREDLPEEKEREFIEIINRGAEHLTRLVEELLEISRLESGKTKLLREEIKLDELLEESLKTLEPVYQPDDIAIDFPSDLPPLYLDRNRMAKCFDVVFKHIRKRCESGTMLRMRAKVDDGDLALTINYRPMGEHRQQDDEHLISRLQWEREEDLEIAMARRIVTAHRGSMNIVSTEGPWSTIVIRLPIMELEEFVAQEKAV